MSHQELVHRASSNEEGNVVDTVLPCKRRSSCENGDTESVERLYRLPRIKPNHEFEKVPIYLKALKVTVHINALLSCVTIVLSWSENQWTASQGNSQTFFSDFLRIVVLILSVLQLVLVCRCYSYKLQLQIEDGVMQPQSEC